MRALIVLALYSAAIMLICGATSMAPNMTWPTTPVEVTAAWGLVMGLLCKMIGHIVLMGYSKRI